MRVLYRCLSNIKVGSTVFVGLCTLYFVTVLNLSLWRFALARVEVNGFSSFIFALSLPILIFTALFIIFSLLIWPRLYKPVLMPLLLVSSVANYAMFQYGIFIDSDMARNVLETNPAEALEYVNFSGLLWVGLSGVLPAILLIPIRVKFKTAGREILRRAAGLLICLLLVGVTAATLFKPYAIFGRNNRQVTRLISPANYIYAVGRYFQRQALASRKFVRLDENVRRLPDADNDITVFVLVLGETARSMNFSLNGYERETNPRLAGQDVISFSDVAAAGTATAVSVPGMFSVLPRKKFDLNDAVYTENILDLLKNAGYDVIWLENDGGCKKVCDRVTVVEVTDFNDPKFCEGGQCHDEILLDPLEELLDKVEHDTVIVLHTIGSHGPAYYRRYPDGFKKFTPTCDNSEVQNCPQESIVNTYDNTILYTDYIASQALEALKKRPELEAWFMYVSDHGESLGENNIYLHGLPYAVAPPEQTQVPMILWMSERMKRNRRVDYGCLKARKAEPYSHDNLFHSLAGMLGLDTRVYKRELDMFTPCRPSSPVIADAM